MTIPNGPDGAHASIILPFPDNNLFLLTLGNERPEDITLSLVTVFDFNALNGIFF